MVLVFNQRGESVIKYIPSNGIIPREDEFLLYLNKRYKVLSVEHRIDFDDINIEVEELS